MRVLVTNDDGVHAPGIGALAVAVVDAGHEVVVAAPDDDRSGASAAIGGMHDDAPITVEPVELPDLGGVECFGVGAPPALIVVAAWMGAFGPPPDMVASGINAGPNTGRAVLHSGTVGAALTGANFGRSALAVSLDVGQPAHWATAATLGAAVLDWLVDQPPQTVVNLNVPNLELDQVRGLRQASLAPFGTVRAVVVESQGGGLELELSGEQGEGDDPPAGSDKALLARGHATVTALVGVSAAEGPELASAVERRLLRSSA